jgi:hypothetical protein
MRSSACFCGCARASVDLDETAFRFLASGRPDKDHDDKVGLTGFGPNINIARVRAGVL